MEAMDTFEVLGNLASKAQRDSDWLSSLLVQWSGTPPEEIAYLGSLLRQAAGPGQNNHNHHRERRSLEPRLS